MTEEKSNGKNNDIKKSPEIFEMQFMRQIIEEQRRLNNLFREQAELNNKTIYSMVKGFVNVKDFLFIPKPIDFHKYLRQPIDFSKKYLTPTIPPKPLYTSKGIADFHKLLPSVPKKGLGIRELLEKIAQNTSSIQYTKLTVDEIDSFYEVSKVKEAQVSQFVPLQLEERAVKEKFHEIIGDPFIQIDWGGERCDIFTSHIRFRNRKTSSAFILKGKSYTKRMGLKLKDFGKNADQLVRLFQEPAEIFFVQSNGPIDSTVETTVQAFVAKKIKEGFKVYYCIIDGMDTARVLSAYGKI